MSRASKRARNAADGLQPARSREQNPLPAAARNDSRGAAAKRSARAGAPSATAGLASSDLAILAALLLAVLVIYVQTGSFEFIAVDDPLNIYQNAHVQSGLSLETLRWALTAVVVANWAPVTVISHLVAVQLFGMNAGMHHLMNVALHALCAMLLFLALRRATGERWLSAFIACLFAVHPLHVESVAWVSERKDVLSTLFWFAALYAYLRYAEKPGTGRYLAVAATFALGLLSKPMLVTFPFTLLLLDIWPLRRTRWPRTILEKLPLLALSAVASVVTYMAQASTGAQSAISRSAATRVENALTSCLTYIGQMFWPARLAYFYPYPPTLPLAPAIVAFVILLAISILAVRALRTRPWFTVGWFWYLGTLVPVIGLVQVGRQLRADRYMYIPMIGLSIILAWGAAEFAAREPRRKFALAAAAVGFCVVCTALARADVAYWRNNETLFRRALEVTTDNAQVEYDLGTLLISRSQFAEATPHLEAALRIEPNNFEAHNNLGAILEIAGNRAAAQAHYEAAVRVKPDYADAQENLASILSASSNPASAIPHFEMALRVKPDYAEAHSRLGMLLANLGRTKEAIAHLEAAQRIQPDAQTADALTRLRSGK